MNSTRRTRNSRFRSARCAGLLAAAATLAGFTGGAFGQPADDGISLSVNATPLSEVMSMISRQEQVNILMSDEIDVSVSLNVFEMAVADAIEAIASAAGYAVERRGGSYFIVERVEVGRFATSDLIATRTFRVEYAEPNELQAMLSPYLSDYGSMSVLAQRKLITIEDTPDFLDRFERLIAELDRPPQQILIEAKILEVSLTSEDSFGIDWSDLFTIRDTAGTLGARGLAEVGGAGAAGFFLTLTNDEVDLLFNALEARGRVRTLSTPKLLSLENQESSVIIGDRRGFQVTTTINQVTSETIEFLESGVILRVTPQVDRNGHVLLAIHPEVSTGNVDANGIPSQVTTEVTTQLLVPSGQTVFIGGLIKHNSTLAQSGIPVLRRIPGLRRVFSNEERTSNNSETIVLITPRVVEDLDAPWNAGPIDDVEAASAAARAQAEVTRSDVTRFER